MCVRAVWYERLGFNVLGYEQMIFRLPGNASMIEYGNSHPHSGSGIDGYRSSYPALKWLVGLFMCC